VFTTPAVLPNTSYPRDRVVYWVEHDANDDYDESHFLARFYDGGGVRACEVRSEAVLGLPSSDLGPIGTDRDAVTGSPVVYGVGPRRVVTLGYEGPLTRWPVAASGWPDCGFGGCPPVVDLSPWPSSLSSNRRGGDTSILVDAQTQTIVWGNKCTSERLLEGVACNSEDSEWGRVNIVDLLTPVAPTGLGNTAVGLDAWVSSAPVALGHEAGQSGTDFLFILGTEESVTEVDVGGGAWEHRDPTCGDIAPFNTQYDCALVTFTWDGTTLEPAHHWDDELIGGDSLSTCCVIPPPPGAPPEAPPTLANGWVGEPVPVANSSVVFAARNHGELYKFEVNPVDGAIDLHSRVRFRTVVPEPGAPPEFQIPPEQSPIIGNYPLDPTNHEMLLMVNDNTNQRSKFLAIDVDSWMCIGPVYMCDLDPAPYVIFETDYGPAGWGPGAAARSLLNPIGPIYDGLAFVFAVGTDVAPDFDATSTACGPAMHPPRLYFAKKALGSSATWSIEHVDLVADEANPICFEDMGGGEFARIDVTAGVTVAGPMVYAATSDGMFWEYDTTNAGAVVMLAGLQGIWPRFRNNNHGMAHP
jgi:hypothetical protein